MGELLLHAERAAVASASRHLADRGLVIGTAGNISAHNGNLVAMASTAVSCCHDELPPVHYSCLTVGGPPRTAAYATYGSQELAENVVATLAGRSAALMQNHGSEMSAAFAAEGLMTLAGSRLYMSMADTDEVVADALSRFETVLAGVVGGADV